VSYAARYVLLFHHFRKILEAAAGEGIDVAPLKGAHLLAAVYPPGEAARPISDVDFLVRAADWGRALALLRRLGLRPRDVGYDETRMHEAGFYLDREVDPGRGGGGGSGVSALFEVHRALFEPRRYPIDHEAIWRRSRPGELEGAPCRLLAAEDHLVHAALHAAVHRLAQLPSAIRDVEMLLRRGGARGETVVERAREWRATRAVWLVLDRLDARAPDLHLAPLARARELAPPWAVRAALRVLVPRDEPAPLLAGLHHRLRAAVLWPLLFDSPAALARFVSGHPWLVLKQ
jgi:hypothetical protein